MKEVPPYRTFHAIGQDPQADSRCGPTGCVRTADECTRFSLCIGDRNREQFEFVGSGGYCKQEVYNFVGDGRGNYEKNESVSYSNYRPRPCAVIVITSALLVGGALGCLLYFNMTSRYSPSETLSIVQGGYHDGCWVRDCMCNHDQLDKWAAERRYWCCEHKGTACPADGSVKPKQGVGKLVGAIRGCASMCQIFGSTYDCFKRINFTAYDTFQNHSDQCVSAYQLVLGQCSFCSACSLAETTCGRELARAALRPVA